MAKVIKLENLEYGRFSNEKIFVVIGFFDGVHKGHLKIINICTENAIRAKGKSIVFTFDKPPANILKGKLDKKLIASFPDKIKLIENTGADYIVIAKFDTIFSGLMPADFCKDILVKRLNVCGIFIGEGFKFGKDSLGDTNFLRNFFISESEEIGRNVIINEVCILKIRGIPVSSTAIRQFYNKGDIDSIKDFLGRYPSIRGTIIKGDERGRLLGFPTANIDVFEKYVTPKDGVYAGFVQIPGLKENNNSSSKKTAGKYAAVINIGNNPTFHGRRKWVESHIIGFDRNIYGKKIKVFFLKRLRDEITFSSKDALINQIKSDIKDAIIYINDFQDNIF